MTLVICNGVTSWCMNQRGIRKAIEIPQPSFVNYKAMRKQTKLARASALLHDRVKRIFRLVWPFSLQKENEKLTCISTYLSTILCMIFKCSWASLEFFLMTSTCTFQILAVIYSVYIIYLFLTMSVFLSWIVFCYSDMIDVHFWSLYFVLFLQK